MDLFRKGRNLLQEFKGNKYVYGSGILNKVGSITADAGKKGVFLRDAFLGSDIYISRIKDSISTEGLEIVGEVDGARPNYPREDLFRIAQSFKECKPDVIVSFGGGSTYV